MPPSLVSRSASHIGPGRRLRGGARCTPVRCPASFCPPARFRTIDGMAVIEVHQLRKRYGDRHAVRDVSFTVEPGEIFGALAMA
ncbi:hypothetical protein GCM10009827_038220 [Dactylosporangium maewongense]|uniref:ABC transporter ATP-binding protein n=1 Tax=Dactylosporangium maewongense TaxID=634393 RepID=A0ABP4L9H4_9ACTN